MMNKLLIIAIVLSAMLLWLKSSEANSVTYKISVTIPAIVGVNVADPQADLKNTPLSSNTSIERHLQESIRNNQMVLLETFVAK